MFKRYLNLIKLILFSPNLIVNYHSQVVVKLNDGRTVDGVVEYVEKNVDLAVVKIDGQDHSPLSMGNVNDVSFDC